MPDPNDPKLSDLQRVLFGDTPPNWNPPRVNSLWLWAIPALFLLLTFGRSFVLVGAGERAVIFNRFSGTQHYQLGEGLRFVLPWIHLPTVYDVKTQTYTMSGAQSEANAQAGNSNDALTALTSDGLPVSLEMSVRFHIDPENVWKVHQEIGPMFVEKVVRPQTRSHVRMVVAQYPVVDVYGARRARIIEQINTRLRRLFEVNHIILDEALLRDVSFSTGFQQAIEEKQIAQQDVQRMTFVLDQADKERRRKIIEAEGEAESIRLKAAALAQNPQLVQYEYVKRLPEGVRTVVTDGRTIVNLGDVLKPGEVAASVEAPPPPAASSSSDEAGGQSR